MHILKAFACIFDVKWIKLQDSKKREILNFKIRNSRKIGEKRGGKFKFFFLIFGFVNKEKVQAIILKGY